MLETDAGAVRELPAGYVADHVEHAYCLTGHGMQGGTVERAFVVASPEDLTAGWSYSALSRARGDTRLLIADLDRRGAERAEVAPREARPTTGRSDVLARVARRMLVRDDEDLAVDQIPAAGREDDPALASHRAARGTPAQEVAAERAQANEPVASVSRLIELREQISRHRVVLGALPTRPLARFDELDAKERELTVEREEHAERLAALDPPTRRLGRVRDAHADERSFLVTALELDERALSEVRAERTRLRRELGDPDQVRSEREGIEAAIDQLAAGLRPGARCRSPTGCSNAARAGSPKRLAIDPNTIASPRHGTGPPGPSRPSGSTTTSVTAAPRWVPNHRSTTRIVTNGIKPTRCSNARSANSVINRTAREHGLDLGIG